MWHNPVRMGFAICVLLILFPELEWLFTGMTGIDGFIGKIAIFVLVVFASIGAPMLYAFCTYHLYPYEFYNDHLEFTDGLLLRERLKISYRAVSKVIVRASAMQKHYGVGHIRLSAETRFGKRGAREQGYELPDIRDAEKARAQIMMILDAYHKRSDSTVMPDSETLAAVEPGDAGAGEDDDAGKKENGD